MLNINTILAAVDFDKHFPRVARVACQIARLCNAQLHFLHVNDPMAGTPSLVAGSLHTSVHTIDDLKEMVYEIVPKELLHEVHASFHVDKGDVVSLIIDKSKKVKSDLIVVGNPKESAVARLFYSPVEEKLLQRSQCDIYAVTSSRELPVD